MDDRPVRDSSTSLRYARNDKQNGLVETTWWSVKNAMENFSLIDQKMLGTSLLYISLSVVAGILAFAAGVWVSRFV